MRAPDTHDGAKLVPVFNQTARRGPKWRRADQTAIPTPLSCLDTVAASATLSNSFTRGSRHRSSRPSSPGRETVGARRPCSIGRFRPCTRVGLAMSRAPIQSPGSFRLHEGSSFSIAAVERAPGGCASGPASVPRSRGPRPSRWKLGREGRERASTVRAAPGGAPSTIRAFHEEEGQSAGDASEDDAAPMSQRHVGRRTVRATQV